MTANIKFKNGEQLLHEKNKECGDDLQLLSKYSQITNTHFKVHKLYDTSIST